MNVRIFDKSLFADNFWLETAIFVIAGAVLMALAAKLCLVSLGGEESGTCGHDYTSLMTQRAASAE